MNGNITQPQIVAGGEPIRSMQGTASLLGKGLILALVAAAVAFLLRGPGTELVSWETIWVLTVGSGLLILMCIAFGTSGARETYPKTAALVIWWFVVSSESFFMRFTGGNEALRGQFMYEAYAEASMWVLAFIALLVATWGRPAYLRQMFSGSSKWLTLYGIVCVASLPLSPEPAFSAGWAIKLVLVILVVQFYTAQVNDVSDVSSFLRATFWAFAYITIAPVTTAFFDPDGIFQEGRLGGVVNYDLGSTEAATLVLLAITLYSSGRRKALVLVGTLGAVVMVLAGGKTGILAGLLSMLLFFAFQKKFGAALGLSAGITVLGTLAVLLTPLGTYLREYTQSGQASSLTGRTLIWEAAVANIWQHPILGHGFAASKFLFNEAVGLPFEAGHMHNGYLEILYNNGIVGLALILMMFLVVFRNLIRVIRSTRVLNIRWMATGCLTIYFSILINAVAAPSFGGRVTGIFAIFLALFGVSEWLVKANDREVALSQVRVEGI